MKPALVRVLVPAVAAAILATVSLLNLWRAGQGVEREDGVAGGVPITLFLPVGAEDSPGGLPAVVVVHGFSGNRQLMYGFGYTLALNGYVAALIDLPGHGASLDPLDTGSVEAGMTQVYASVDAALERVRSLPFVDPDRVAILGHSMGAGVVAGYGAAHGDVAATIALSLGGAGADLAGSADRPRNFLVLAGANEFDDFKTAGLAALAAAYPGGVAGRTYGDFARGTARRADLVPGVEHITILFSHDTYRQVVQWLDAALAMPARESIRMDGRMPWVLLLYLAAAIGFYPLAWVVLAAGSRPAPAVPRDGLPGWAVVVLSVAGAAISPVILLAAPYAWMPLSVGNYVGVYFLVYGLLLAAGAWLARRRRPSPAGTAAPATWRAALGTGILTGYALVTFNLTAHLTWTSMGLAGERLWVAGVLFGFMLVYFWADEALVQRRSRRARAGLYALTKAIVLVSLVVAILVFQAPFFILLLLPVLVALFAWQGLYSHWLYGFTGRAWPAAVMNAAVFAWVIAATFAIV